MKLLLDTHVFIWWDSDPAKLSKKALALCGDSANTLLLSVASAWEMQIKMQLGKMKLDFPLPDIINDQRRENGLQIIPVALEHVLALPRIRGRGTGGARKTEASVADWRREIPEESTWCPPKELFKTYHVS